MSNTLSAAYNHDEASSRLTELPGAAGTILAPPDGKRCPAAGGQPADRTKLHSDVVDALGIASQHAEVKPEAAPLPPQHLLETPNWVLWRSVPRGPGEKAAKRPYRIDGLTPASTTNPTTWATYDEARRALLNGARHCDGLGVVLTDNLAGIDLDLPVDDPQSREVIDHFKGSYCEMSPNGRLRVFCLGTPRHSGKRGPAEVYGAGSPRYLTVTGDHIAGTSHEVTEQQESLDWFHQRYLAEPTKSAGDPAPEANNKAAPAAADDTLIAKASAAENGAKFRALFAGDTAGFPSQSEADLALCSILAFWTQNRDQIDRVFRRSNLFREKWDQRFSDGSTYGSRTVAKAIANCLSSHGAPAEGKTKTDKPRNKTPGLFARVIDTVKKHPELKGVRFDQLDGAAVLADGSPIPPEMVLDLRLLAETQTRSVGEGLAHDAIKRVALGRPFDALQEMFEKLPAWDGESRLNTWPIRYLGAADDEISRQCGRMWLISAVARAYKPGCQAKYVLVLQGPQDLGKSKIVERLAGSPRFFMAMGGHEIGSRDTKLAISRKWIGEFAELGKLPMSERNVVKAFISDTSDTFRAPYARADVTAPRRCVFIVTENPDGTGWLNDPTGGVRWWPIPCTSVDFEAFDRDRDQLLAEALVAYRAGEPWWPAAPIVGLHERQEALQRSDPWLEEVQAVLEDGHVLGEAGEILLADVVLGLRFRWKKQTPEDLSSWTPAHDQRVAGCLKRLGFSPAPNPVWRTYQDPHTEKAVKRKVRPWRRAGTAE